VRPRHLFVAAALGVLALLAANVAAVFTASNPIADAGRVGQQSQALVAGELKPAECTGSVTSVVTVSGKQTYSGSNVLVLGSSGNDNVAQNAGGGYTCFVGGGGSDKFTGWKGAGDECIVSTATPAKNITQCNVVASRP
jgi:hypothetical protein